MAGFGAVIRNSAWNVIGLVVTMAAGLFYVPYLVGHLGVASYGMVPLITGLFVWFAWISLAVSWSVGRYVTFAREKGDVQLQNRYFNSALFPSVLLCFVVICVGVLLVPFVPRIIRIPEGSEGSVAFLWLCGTLVAGFGIVSGAADVGTFCRNRFDIRAMIQVARTAIMIAVVLALFRFRGPRLEWVGIGTVIGSAVSLGLVLLSLKYLLPEVKIRPALFDRVHFREMVGTNAWVVLDQFGTILLLNVDLFLVNRFFGPQASGQYALAIQWVGILRGMMTAMTVFTPSYVVYVARGDLDGLASYATKASRFVGYTMAILIGVVLGLAYPLTETWLHRDPGLVAPLVVVLTLPLAFNASINPLYGVWQALIKVRIPSFATLAAGVSGIVLATILAKTTSLGIFSVAVAVGFAYTARNLGFSTFYVGRLLGQGQAKLMRVSLEAGGVAVTIGVAGHLLASWLQFSGWIAVGVAGCLLAGLGTVLIWFGCLSGEEREQLTDLLIARIRKRHAYKQT